VKRIGPARLFVVALWVAAGCSEAVYTLGRIPGDAPSSDASTSDAPNGNPDASGGSGDSGGSAGSGGNAGTGGLSGTGGTGGDAGPMCTVERAAAVRRGLNLYLMVDSSFAIALQPVWPQLTQGITAFVDDAANTGLGVGIQFYGAMCSEQFYATPRVPVAPLPGVAASIRTSFPAPVNGVAASISPAVEGGSNYAAMLETSDPDRETDLVIFSDGLFDTLTCGSGIVEATSAASLAFGRAPSIRTHVIAIDAGLLGVFTDLSPLDGLAAAGGSGTARRVQVDLASAAQIQAALQQLTDEAMPCAFKVPSGFVAARTALEWRVIPNQAPTIWPQVANVGACGNNAAVYPVSGSTYLQLCPTACATLHATPAGRLEMRQECP